MYQPHGNNLGNREVHFASRQESHFPNLMRLCLDFNFRVLDQRGYQLMCSDAVQAITPAFAELDQLERHVQLHLVDILHDYLFDAGLDAVAH